jgi:hypothetical protein
MKPTSGTKKTSKTRRERHGDGMTMGPSTYEAEFTPSGNREGNLERSMDGKSMVDEAIRRVKEQWKKEIA